MFTNQSEQNRAKVKFSMAWEADPERCKMFMNPVTYTDPPALIAQLSNKVEGSQQILFKNTWVCCHLLYRYGLDKILPGFQFDESKFQKRRNILAQLLAYFG